MIKFEIEKFVEEVESELLNYEDLDVKDMLNFKKGFMELVEKNKISKKNFKDGVHFEIFDEMEIFTIADDYVDAVFNNDLKTFWKSFE